MDKVIDTIKEYPYKGTTTNQKAYCSKSYRGKEYILHSTLQDKKNYKRCETKVIYYDYGNKNNHYTNRFPTKCSEWLKECPEVIVWINARYN